MAEVRAGAAVGRGEGEMSNELIAGIVGFVLGIVAAGSIMAALDAWEQSVKKEVEERIRRHRADHGVCE